MRIFLTFLVIFCISSYGANLKTSDKAAAKVRRKRYVAFPEGASITIALCVSARVIAPTNIFTEGVNWGISYDLPNKTTFIDYKTNYKSNFLLRRRHRRDVYNRIEDTIDAMGFDGKSCVYRAICEVTRRFNGKKNTLSEEIIKILFRFPHEAISEEEPEDHHLYHWAYKRGRDEVQQECSMMFPACSISLIDLALGYYNHYQPEDQPSMAGYR